MAVALVATSASATRSTRSDCYECYEGSHMMAPYCKGKETTIRARVIVCLTYQARNPAVVTETVAEFKAAIQREWDRIILDQIRKRIREMP